MLCDGMIEGYVQNEAISKNAPSGLIQNLSSYLGTSRRNEQDFNLSSTQHHIFSKENKYLHAATLKFAGRD